MFDDFAIDIVCVANVFGEFVGVVFCGDEMWVYR